MRGIAAGAAHHERRDRARPPPRRSSLRESAAGALEQFQRRRVIDRVIAGVQLLLVAHQARLLVRGRAAPEVPHQPREQQIRLRRRRQPDAPGPARRAISAVRCAVSGGNIAAASAAAASGHSNSASRTRAWYLAFVRRRARETLHPDSMLRLAIVMLAMTWPQIARQAAGATDRPCPRRLCPALRTRARRADSAADSRRRPTRTRRAGCVSSISCRASVILQLEMRTSADGPATFYQLRVYHARPGAEPARWRRRTRPYCCDEHAARDAGVAVVVSGDRRWTRPPPRSGAPSA